MDAGFTAKVLCNDSVHQDSAEVRMLRRFHGTFCGSQGAHTYVIDEDGDLDSCVLGLVDKNGPRC